MRQQLAHVALLVDEYDRAIAYYTRVLGFELVEDTPLSDTKRWVVVRPPGSTCSLLLARAANEVQQQRIGDQSGGRVFLFLHTDDLARDVGVYRGNGVAFVREPVREAWGMVAVFRDRYGNLWDLIQPGA